MNRGRSIGATVALATAAVLIAAPSWAAGSSPVPSPPASPAATPSPSPTPTGPERTSPAARTRAAAITTSVGPRVAAAGSLVSASGSGCARIHIVVDGQPKGFDDVPERHLDRTITATGGTWRITFPMPVDPSTVEITCLDPGSTATSLTMISAPHAGITSPATDDGRGLLSVQINPADPPAPPVELFTEDGTRVHGAISPLGIVSFRAPAGASSVTILAMEQLGENAGARQTKRVQSWTTDLASTATPTASPTPATTPAGSGNGLAPSGGDATFALVGLLLLLVGAAMAIGIGAGRRGTRRRALPLD